MSNFKLWEDPGCLRWSFEALKGVGSESVLGEGVHMR